MDLSAAPSSQSRPEGGWITPWLARTLIENGRVDAVEELAAAGDGYCVLVLAEWVAGRGDVDGALEMIAPLVEQGLWGAIQASACLLEEAGRVEEAVTVYRAVLESSSLSASSTVVRTLARHGHGDEAFAMVRPRVNDWFYAGLLVDISDGLGRDVEVMEALDEFAESLSRTCDGGFRCNEWQAADLRAVVLERQGRIDEAVRLLQEYVHPHSSTIVNVVEHLADVLARHDRDDELRALIDGYGQERAAFRLARHLENTGDAKGAIALLTPMAADGSRNPSSYLAGILERADRPEEAADVLTRAVMKDREGLLWHWQEFMVKHGRAEEALGVVDRLAKESSGLTEDLYGARVCLLALTGHGEQAVEEVFARSADEWDAAEEVSYALAAAGQPELAIKVLEPGFRNGDHQEPMALHMIQQGRIGDALDILPRTQDMRLYIPPALRPKLGTF